MATQASETDVKDDASSRHSMTGTATTAPESAAQTAPEASQAEAAKPSETDENYKPKTLKFWLIIASVFLSMFLVALDRTILATAVPRITDDFKSLGDIGWYGASYMLATAACQLLFGRVYRFYSLRVVFLSSIVVFEVGSALCGAAPNSNAFIIGRAIAGVGSAGIWTGSMMSIIPMVPLHKRPMFQGLFGMVFGISSVIGPLLGGAFTEHVTWRWCFYMNLPIGGAAFVLLLLFMHPHQAAKPKEKVTITRQILRLDPLGTFFFIPSTLCLLLALQWGGTTYPWSNWRIIVLFVVAGVTALAFATVQVTMPDTATLPARIIKQRTMVAGTFYMLFTAGGMIMVIYYLPLWFQAVKGVDPIKSGIYTIPMVLSLVVASLLSGFTTQKIGYYTPSMLICPCLMAIGEGLLSTLKPDSGSSHWIGYQFLAGFGLGLGMQSVGLAVQATLPKDDISTGIAITFFAQQLGGAIFVSVGQTILGTLLVKQLTGIPGLDPMDIVRNGATQLRDIVSADELHKVVDAYNYAIVRIFYCALALAFAQLISGFFIEWRSIKKKPANAENASAGEAEKAGKAEPQKTDN